MKCRLIRPMHGDGGVEVSGGKRRHKILRLPVGHEIDHPDAYLLVQQGVAEPADDECREAHGMTDEQLAQARAHYEMADRGIAPEDYEAFKAGALVGYDADGNWIPGPGYDAWAAAHGDEEDDEAE